MFSNHFFRLVYLHQRHNLGSYVQEEHKNTVSQCMDLLFFITGAKILVCGHEEFIIFLSAVFSQQWISIRLAADLTSVLPGTKRITPESVSLRHTAQRGRFISFI